MRKAGGLGGLRAAGETSRKDPWGQSSRLGPGLKGLTGYCTRESLERSRAGGHRSALDLRKVSERQHRGIGKRRETSLLGRDGGLSEGLQAGVFL